MRMINSKLIAARGEAASFLKRDLRQRDLRLKTKKYCVLSLKSYSVAVLSLFLKRYSGTPEIAALKKTIFMLLILATTLGCTLHAQSLFGPNNNSILRKGNLDYKNGKYNNALLKYNQVYRKKLNDPLLNYNMGTILYKKGNFDTAAYFFDNAIKYVKDPKLKSKAYYNLGNAFMKQQKYDKATQSYSNALKYNPTDQDSRYNLSYALRKLKNQQQQKPKENKDQNPPPDKKENKIDQSKAQELIKSLNNKEQEQNKKIKSQGNNTKSKDW